MPITAYRLVTFVILIITVVGGVIVIVNPDALTFNEYVRDLAIAWGLLGIGHGIDNKSTP